MHVRSDRRHISGEGLAVIRRRVQAYGVRMPIGRKTTEDTREPLADAGEPRTQASRALQEG
jgi:pyridoxine 5'-phosphate synthase PdxJ